MTQAVKKDASKPHYHGHRDRLRERFINGGPDSLADYELLELILFMAIPRRDVKPLAKDLLTRFGNLPGVMNAPVGELKKFSGLSDTTITALKAIQATAHRMLKQEVIGKPILNSWSRLLDYCAATMAHETRESFRILFLNKKNELIADEIQQTGTVDHTPAYPREIMKRALELGATAIILCHNHPSGDPTPSQADIDMTRAIAAAGQPFSIVTHDHIIVSKNGTSSFKTMGLL
ncbi:MAG: DNA repair protein RadC [Rhodospirillales bacterium]|nr:DNA repair protein RadC [Rhodospirillales bacterium]MCB9995146.1 DNA repair protein RadC [Rhodospirillales bacterium]